MTDSLPEWAGLEEAEELEELEQEPLEEVLPSLNLTNPQIQSQISNITQSFFPGLILDSRLNIFWKNSAFTNDFDSYGEEVFNNLSHYFFKKDVDSMGKAIQAMASPDFGYSWYGQVKSKQKGLITKLLDVFILPVRVPSSADTPLYYSAIINDVTENNRVVLRNMFMSLLEASKLKDNDTGNHIERVNRYSYLMAVHLSKIGGYNEIDEDFIDNIRFLASMHDVGKIGTPDDILNKEGPLETWEREIMNEHTINGAYILSTYPNPMAREIALFHHERWNGTGYPYRIREKMIPLASRIVAIADVYDALRMKRSYKPAFTHGKAQSIIESGKGSHFDPQLIKYFVELEKEFNEIFSRLKDD